MTAALPETILRRAGPEDAPKLALLGSATFLTAFASDHPGEALVDHCTIEHGVARYAAWLEQPDYALWLIETPLGAPIAYAMLCPPELDITPDADALELKRIYALSGWQGAGLGQRLMEAVIDEARARGAPSLYLCVYTINVAAQRFYARFGFEQVGQQQFMTGNVPFTDWILRKAL
ncbi:GNAT family N-acetyltransferase [Blastomonas sp. AAP53]|uniref:GNAT family N-acetyltransferase n=1 Tax=Blastomonas sp. AAP53 TaxID=1248760 RepID=UPI0003638377|nr:GNAT family N-acetyltransferase [Blastomonas sp. AAP53]